MPKIIRITLTPEQQEQLRQRSRRQVVAPRLRDRLEMVRLSDLGWPIPQIARYLQAHQQTVRKYLKAFLTDGFAALDDRPRSGRPPVITGADVDALVALLTAAAAGGRSWTLRQLCAWLAEQRNVRISTEHLSDLLRQRKVRYKRTYRSLRHKQKDPDVQAAAQADLASLIFEGGRPAGRPGLGLSG